MNYFSCYFLLTNEKRADKVFLINRNNYGLLKANQKKEVYFIHGEKVENR